MNISRDINTPRPPGSRRAFVSAVVIVTLLLLSGIVAAQMRRVVMDRRQQNLEMEELQAHYLAKAGLLRAQIAQEVTEDYDGELWNIAAGEIHQTKSASVQIEVDQKGICRAVARFPANIEIPCQVTRMQRLNQ